MTNRAASWSIRINFTERRILCIWSDSLRSAGSRGARVADFPEESDLRARVEKLNPIESSLLVYGHERHVLQAWMDQSTRTPEEDILAQKIRELFS